MKYLTLIILVLAIGCNKHQLPQLETTVNERVLAPSKLVITDRNQLNDHVGDIVTLVGTQTPSIAPRVVGVIVNGDFELSDQTVSVTGRLESYEVTQDDIDRMLSDPDIGFAAISTRVGVHFRLVDPETGGACRTVKYLGATPDVAER